MTETKDKAQYDLLVCQRCGGKGADGGRSCPVCRGLGSGIIYGRFFLFWGRRVDDFYLLITKLKRALSILSSTILVLLILTGLASLALLLRTVQQPTDLLAAAYWQSPHRNLLVFWFGLLCACFTYYRSVTAAALKETVQRRAYGEKMQPFAAAADADVWKSVWKLPRRSRLDVSRAYSAEATKALEAAYRLARKLRNAGLGPVHLFAALLSTVKVSVMFGRFGLRFEKFKDKLGNMLGALGRDQAATELTSEMRGILIRAYIEAYEHEQPLVEVTEIFLANVRASEGLQELLYDLNVDMNKVDNVVSWIRVQDLLRRRYSRFSSAARLKPKSNMNRSMTAVATPFLDQISHDMTKAAAFGHYAPSIDREKEFEAVFRVIEGGRRSVVLVGEPGVGKEAMIEGVAQRMVEEDVPAILQDKRLVSVNIAQLVSGASAADAQERLLNALYEVARAGNIVLVVPNVAGMVGITSGSGESIDLSQVFATELSRGYFFCIATATPREYADALEGSPLGRALVKVDVPEMDINRAIQVLEAKAGGIEYTNGVFFSYDAVDAAVSLSDRYMHEQFLPEKAIEIAKEAATAVRNQKGRDATVSKDDVASVIAEKTRIPLKTLTEEESQKLLGLEQRMHGRVIGQVQAVSAVASAMRRARAELGDKSRPIANFLFLGPTGVGKTELAKTLADVYFGSEDSMIRLDMSEYQDKASLYRLIGEPAGDKAGGILSEAIRKQPFSLLLLDEIEKANPDILTVFLQVMDDGRLTDNIGRVIDFTNVILIATSNAGSQYIQDEIKKNTPIAVIKEGMMTRELRPYYRPEFLNRFDDVIVFTPLSPGEIEQITRLMLAKVAKRLETKGIIFEVTDEAIKELATIGYDPLFGARPLRRTIQDRVDNVIAEALLRGKLGRRDRLIFEKGGTIRVEKAAKL